MPNLLAMHMSNELLSPAVATATLVLAAGAIILASRRVRQCVLADRVPLMGVLGAFVFAGQMINFAIPGLGTSGHLGGGVLLAIVLGPWAGILVMSAILIVQCLLFQDGGLLALGCNILNMGVVSCLVGWGVFGVLAGRLEKAAGWRMYLSAWLASVLAMLAGAAMVPLQAGVSGVLAIPWQTFLSAMLLLHLPIGAVEGLITFAVLAYLVHNSPAMAGLPADMPGRRVRAGRPAVLASLLAAALVVGGVASWFASTLADGLETAQTQRYVGTDTPLNEPSPIMVEADELVSRSTVMPDYGKRDAPLGELPAEQAPAEPAESSHWPNVDGWTSLAGIVGSIATMALVYLLNLGLRRKAPRTN